MFRLGSHKRASDYNKAFEEICNNVRAKCKMPEDFLEAFEAREEIDWESKKPILKVETAPATTASAAEVAVYQTKQNSNQSEHDNDYRERELKKKCWCCGAAGKIQLKAITSLRLHSLLHLHRQILL